MQTRTAASVLPDPVGAAISVWPPAATSSQPAACGSVGPPGNRRSNQVRTAGWNISSTRSRYLRAPTLPRSLGPATNANGGASRYPGADALRPVAVGMYRCGAISVSAGIQPSPGGGGTSAKLPTRAGDSTSVPATGAMISTLTGASPQPGSVAP